MEDLTVFQLSPSITFSRFLMKEKKLTPTRGFLCIRGYNAKRWIKTLTESETSTLPSGFMLDKNHRVLHYIILEILCPKGGTKNNVSNFEVFLLWVIETDHPIKLGFLIIQKMIFTLHKGYSHLPYFMISPKFTNIMVKFSPKKRVILYHLVTSCLLPGLKA